jgi:hypothetical protein
MHNPENLMVKRKLIHYGWLKNGRCEDIEREFEKALLAYQSFFGISKTGVVDLHTQKSILHPRFCGHPDVMSMTTENLVQWPLDGRPITWCITSEFPTLSKQDAADAYKWAFDQWMAVCGIDVRYNPNEKTASILVRVQPIDGRAGVLAQSQLPNGTRDQPMEQFFDSSEPFVFKESTLPHEVDIGRVACHENGHVIGINHIDAGNLLQPMYDYGIRVPQAGDIEEAQKRYGPPKISAPNPSPENTFSINISGSGKIGNVSIPGFKIEKI